MYGSMRYAAVGSTCRVHLAARLCFLQSTALHMATACAAIPQQAWPQHVQQSLNRHALLNSTVVAANTPSSPTCEAAC